jgi:DEAD/DEAH box helicase domain-containing protein
MKISVAGVYDTLEERFRIFREDQVDDLLALIEKADLIVGFNIKRFDYDVIKGYTAKDLRELPTFDILEDIHQRLGYRLSLDHLAVETLHRSKSGDGLQALEWFKAGEMEKLSEYCLLDVEITKAIFEYGLEKGHIVYRTKQEGQRVLLRVDWNLASLIPTHQEPDQQAR